MSTHNPRGSTAIAARDIDTSFVPRVRPGCSSVELEGEVIVVDDESGGVHLLNPTAQIAWACFDGSGTIADIAADLGAVFTADRADITQALTDLARRLGRSGLLEGVEPRGDVDGVPTTAETAAPPRDGRPTARQERRFSGRPPST